MCLRSTHAISRRRKSACYKKHMNKMDLTSLSNDELLLRVSKIVNQSRRVESMLVAHLAEVDVRRLYASEALPSMFQYCRDVLHLSESEAYLRIEAARMSRRHPMVLTMLEDGRLHLSGIATLAPQLKKLTPAVGVELLARAVHKSKRELKELVAELAPKPDVPPSVRKVPRRVSKTRKTTGPETPQQERPEVSSETHPSGEPPTTSGPSEPQPPSASASEARDPRAKVEPLAPARYVVRFTASGELRDKLERLTALTPGSDLASIIDAAVSEKLERLEARRFAKTSKPRKNLDDADTSSGVRGISAPVRRFVWQRDSGQCTFVTEDGRRCPERHRLEYHHEEAYGLGGDRSAGNVRLLCGLCRYRHKPHYADYLIMPRRAA